MRLLRKYFHITSRIVYDYRLTCCSYGWIFQEGKYDIGIISWTSAVIHVYEDIVSSPDETVDSSRVLLHKGFQETRYCTVDITTRHRNS